MIYREYGQTGEKVSLLGFGGMRFKNVDDHDECVRMMVAAAKGGINYFDTAPGYFETRSETVFGKGFAEMRKLGLPYFSATKTFESTETGIRKEIEAQLKRLDIPAIDFYHIWCITSLGGWENRKKDGILQTFRKLKEEGLIRHICISSHLIKSEIRELLMEGVFEGVLFGYSAYNFQTRQEAFDAIREKKLGAVVMNPLGGGVIPDHPELFKFIRRDGESTVAAALRVLWDHPEISVTLVGFDTIQHLNEALQAIEGYKPRTAAELEETKSKASASFEGICTGCAYCDNCPQEIPIPYFMDSYNQKLLNKNSKDPIGERLKWHWSLDKSVAGKCTSCGQCEDACTQHINIIERLKEIAG
ncbi:MAG: aldo/keto reductase [Treponema sp.]|jgi:predicted aldo/keto reductase-like oxidoreductase|nr:aldo/keto reductase [Treponema sp.]